MDADVRHTTTGADGLSAKPEGCRLSNRLGRRVESSCQ
jgi:hypothetical protein